MTAEVGVLNRTGVALAADSAVTIGSRADKIYTSSDKLFHLSQTAPIGIMIYGNANFVGLPWETIVKAFRRKLGEKVFGTVEEYADRFLRFLRQNRQLFPRAQQDRTALQLIESLFIGLRSEICNRLSREAEQRDGLDEDEIPPIVATVVQGRLKEIRSRAVLEDVARSKDAIRRRLTSKITKIRAEVFGELPMNPATRRQLSSIAIEMLTRHYFWPMRAGVVVAGFGEEEFMPCMYAYDLEEMIQDRPRCKQILAEKIGHDNDASVVPFAQQEMVHVFMNGIDSELAEFMALATSEMFERSIRAIVDTVRKNDPTLASAIQRAVKTSDLLDGLFDQWKTASVQYWAPVVQIVSSLPKDELASMAEALVNLTKFRRRVTPERETVGGPIDVAVITKGDGFVWIRRKHYFEASLNPRTIARYTKEG